MHNMLSFMLNPCYKSFCHAFSFVGWDQTISIVEEWYQNVFTYAIRMLSTLPMSLGLIIEGSLFETSSNEDYSWYIQAIKT
jgi:hypothetical protein